MSAEPEQLLKHIAAIAHCGGMFNMSDAQARDSAAIKARVVNAMRSRMTMPDTLRAIQPTSEAGE